MMTLDEYMKVLRARVDEFESDWRKNQATKEDQYPKTLGSSAEWDEQFDAFVDMETSI
jgi:hypothetical protein